MLRLLLTVTIVAALSRGIAEIDEQTSAAVYGSTSAGSDWVRTADGWERSSALSAPAPSEPGALHPILVAALQAGVSVMALLGFSKSGGPAPEDRRLAADLSQAPANAYRLV